MSVSTRLKELLETGHAPYETRTHRTVYTAAEVAEAMHIPGKEMAKTVIVNADGLLRMAVLPANHKLNLRHLQWVMRSDNVRLATENEFKDVFPSCELGAMPPFGNLFGLSVYCDTRLANNDFIEFNAGTHTETIRMPFEEFKRLARPTMIDLVVHGPERAA